MYKDYKRTKPILYSFRRCPFAIRARLAIYFSKIEVELREVFLNDKPKEMLKISPKATVPVLHSNDQVLDESLDIMVWALEKYDHLDILKPYNEQKLKTLKFIKYFDICFKYHLDRYKYSSRYTKGESFSNKKKHRDFAMKYILILEKNFSDKELYIYMGRKSILDIAIFPLIRQYRIADITWFDNQKNIPHTKKWLYNILESNYFKNTMTKYKNWNKTKISYSFKSI